MRRISVLATSFLFSLLLFTSCSKERIPKEDFKKVLKDIFLTDLIIQREGQLSQMADSALVYKPVLDKHGYTTGQFLATLDYYVGRPDRLKSLLRQLRESVNEERTAFNAYVSELQASKELSKRFHSWLHDNSNRYDFVPREALKQILSPDLSAIPVWRMDRDSLYKAPRLRILPVLDTCSVKDSVPVYLLRSKQVMPVISFQIK